MPISIFIIVTNHQYMNINLEKFIDKDFDWQLNYGYPQNKFYTNNNTELFQCFDNAPTPLLDFAKKTFLKYSITMIKQPPGNFIPNHVDKYYMFKKKFNISDNEDIVRYCIFLEDWMPGQYFEVNDVPFLNWKKGDICILKQGIYHRSANAGDTNKYTAQITGVLK